MDCLCNSWKIEDINDANITQHYIYRDIKPNTKYVVYVQMYVTNMKSGQSEFSPYQYFTTDPGGECVNLCCYSRLRIGARVNVTDPASECVLLHIQACSFLDSYLDSLVGKKIILVTKWVLGSNSGLISTCAPIYRCVAKGGTCRNVPPSGQTKCFLI